MSGTDGRVYGGDSELIHVADGQRTHVAKDIAAMLDMQMRRQTCFTGERTGAQAASQKLCPGCYMVIGFDLLVYLAQQNGQSLVELGATMSAAFQRLTIDAAVDPNGVTLREEIVVIIEGDH